MLSMVAQTDEQLQYAFFEIIDAANKDGDFVCVGATRDKCLSKFKKS